MLLLLIFEKNRLKGDEKFGGRLSMEDVQGTGDLPDPGMLVKESQVGDQVILHLDGKFCAGTIIEVDKMNTRYRVMFNNDSTCWSSARAVTGFVQKEESEVCKICGKAADDGSRCRSCSAVFHKCLKQSADSQCSKCSKNKTSKENIRRPSPKLTRGAPKPRKVQTGKRILPYQLSSLTWDPLHRVNEEKTYCYCGMNGEWSKKMLQCCQCRQWFHGACVSCLQYPLLNGDRFYKFICGVCNIGAECLNRLPLTLTDVLRIIMFDLQEETGEKMFDFDRLILPHLERKWEALQLPPTLKRMTEIERREAVLEELRSHSRSHFLNGREYNKKTSIWALRISVPPAPTLRETPNGSPVKSSTNSPAKGCKIKALNVLEQPDIVLSTLSASTVDDLISAAKIQIAPEESPEASSQCPSTRASSEERPFVMAANERLLRTRSATLLAPVIAERHDHNKDASDAKALAAALKMIERKRKRKWKHSISSSSLATPSEVESHLSNGTVNIVEHMGSLAIQYCQDMNPFRLKDSKLNCKKNRKLSAKDLIIHTDGKVRLRKLRKKTKKRLDLVSLTPKKELQDLCRVCVSRRLLPNGSYEFLYEDSYQKVEPMEVEV